MRSLISFAWIFAAAALPAACCCRPCACGSCQSPASPPIAAAEPEANPLRIRSMQEIIEAHFEPPNLPPGGIWIRPPLQCGLDWAPALESMDLFPEMTDLLRQWRQSPTTEPEH